jgi:hypothetical protein
VEDGSVRDAQLLTDWDLDRDNKVLTVNHKDIREVFSGRYPFGAGGYWADEAAHLPGKFVAAGLQVPSIAALIVQRSLEGPFPIFSLPIAIPALFPGPFGRTDFHYNFPRTDSLLKEIQESNNGPDIAFPARWQAGREGKFFEWEMVIGDPKILGPIIDFYMNAERPGLTNVHKSKDGVQKVTGVFSVGAGSGNDMLVQGFGTGDLGDTTSVARDVQQALKDVVVESDLLGQSQARLAVNRYSTVQWEAKFLAHGDGDRVHGNVALGTIFRLHFNKDWWEPDGYIDLRVIGLSGDMSEVITPSLQPVGA